jgi:hypothetical protein
MELTVTVYDSVEEHIRNASKTFDVALLLGDSFIRDILYMVLSVSSPSLPSSPASPPSLLVNKVSSVMRLRSLSPYLHI